MDLWAAMRRSAGMRTEGGRPVILCVNKWDLVTSGKRKEFEQNVRDHLKFLDYAPMIFRVRAQGYGRYGPAGVDQTRE